MVSAHYKLCTSYITASYFLFFFFLNVFDWFPSFSLPKIHPLTLPWQRLSSHRVVSGLWVHKPWKVAITVFERNYAVRVCYHKGINPLCLARFLSDPSTVNWKGVTRRQIWGLLPWGSTVRWHACRWTSLYGKSRCSLSCKHHLGPDESRVLGSALPWAQGWGWSEAIMYNYL